MLIYTQGRLGFPCLIVALLKNTGRPTWAQCQLNAYVHNKYYYVSTLSIAWTRASQPFIARLWLALINNIYVASTYS